MSTGDVAAAGDAVDSVHDLNGHQADELDVPHDGRETVETGASMDYVDDVDLG